MYMYMYVYVYIYIYRSSTAVHKKFGIEEKIEGMEIINLRLLKRRAIDDAMQAIDAVWSNACSVEQCMQ